MSSLYVQYRTVPEAQGFCKTYLTHEATLKLIKLVRKHENLWNKHDECYDSYGHNLVSWNAIITELFEKGFANADCAINTWNNIYDAHFDYYDNHVDLEQNDSKYLEEIAKSIDAREESEDFYVDIMTEDFEELPIIKKHFYKKRNQPTNNEDEQPAARQPVSANQHLPMASGGMPYPVAGYPGYSPYGSGMYPVAAGSAGYLSSYSGYNPAPLDSLISPMLLAVQAYQNQIINLMQYSAIMQPTAPAALGLAQTGLNNPTQAQAFTNQPFGYPYQFYGNQPGYYMMQPTAPTAPVAAVALAAPSASAAPTVAPAAPAAAAAPSAPVAPTIASASSQTVSKEKAQVQAVPKKLEQAQNLASGQSQQEPEKNQKAKTKEAYAFKNKEYEFLVLRIDKVRTELAQYSDVSVFNDKNKAAAFMETTSRIESKVEQLYKDFYNILSFTQSAELLEIDMLRLIEEVGELEKESRSQLNIYQFCKETTRKDTEIVEPAILPNPEQAASATEVVMAMETLAAVPEHTLESSKVEPVIQSAETTAENQDSAVIPATPVIQNAPAPRADLSTTDHFIIHIISILISMFLYHYFAT